MKPSRLLLFSLTLFFISQERVFSAACCGGGFALPSIISGDDKAQLTSSLSYSEIHADVYTNGLWKKRQERESSETLRIDASHIFKDRWQVGSHFPIIKRSRAEKSSSGLGDISTLLGYEYLTDWDYHPYRPKGIGFFQVILPTGRSIYESDGAYGLDSRGRGFWAFGLGTLLTKTFGKYDVFLNLEAHRSLNKKISKNGMDGTLKPGWGGNVDFGAGYNIKDFRIGGDIALSYEEGVAIKGTVVSSGSSQRFATLGFSIGYMLNDEWASSLTYSDQTILGSPYNTTVSRAIMMMLQRRWPR